KSTLIKAIMGLVEYNSGFVKIFDQDLERTRKRISYVPQRESVDWDFPSSALDIVMMGTYHKLGLFRRPGKKEKALAMSCLEKVNMAPFADRQISELSGCKHHRNFIRRVLAQEADIYFMDELIAAADISTQKAIVTLPQEMTAAGKTVVVVHQDIFTASDHFASIILH